MNLFPKHKSSLKYYAVIFLVFGFILLLCGTLFENENSELGTHQETMYRQDQVHYWAGIPFIVLAIVSILFIILEYAFLLKTCICLDFICVNIAIFVIIVEGPDWKKYEAKVNHYSSSSDVDYLMLKPVQDVGSYDTPRKSTYTSAMHYSGCWVVVAILSILLGIEAFLTHLKVYCGIESIFGYLTGYELVHPEIVLKTAQPIEKFECKGCQTKALTPIQSPIKERRPIIPHSPPTLIKAPILQMPGPPNRSVSPTPSDLSDASNAFYVCQEGDGIKLVGYKPRRRGPSDAQLCTHHEEEEGTTDHYHFSRKHPSEVADPHNAHLPHTSGNKNPTVSPSVPTPPPLFLPNSLNPTVGNQFSRKLSSDISDPKYGDRLSPFQDHRVSPGIPKPPTLPPIPRRETSENANNPSLKRSPGRYPTIGEIFPPLPSTPSLPAQGREKGRVSFMDAGNKDVSPGSKRNSKLETLF